MTPKQSDLARIER
uniref:Uncharacterized protein n=1 Tax=Arundo donax TaxID=35708 RepID=A0A0A9G048_ARUDO